MPTRACIPLVALACLLHAGCLFDRDEGIQESVGIEEKKATLAEQAEPAPPPSLSADTHLAAGRMLERQGDLASAIGQYERAITLDPRSPTAYSRLGIVYQKLGRFEDAEQIFKRGIQADPGSAMLRNNLGYGYLLQSRPADAESQFREALRIEPEFKRARMNLAIAIGSLGRYAEATEEFKTVVTPDIAHYNVAMLQMNRGEYSQARASLEAALDENPACPGAREQLQRAVALASGQGASLAPPGPGPQSTLAGTPNEEITGGDP
ncbi:MAG: hypothetical protein DCC65_14795 [Planctomycetota bacterium]|nr:MAG: hypothetical protein DCC65_14795 [Planctomycetota bacterium]